MNLTEKKIDIAITGMTCGIEKGLNQMEGVQNATVNLALETGRVSFDPTVLSSSDFIKKIQSLGYNAEFKNEQPGEIKDHRKSRNPTS